MFNNDTEISINNRFDYSNIIPDVNNITYIIQYLDGLYNQFKKLVDEDEMKNEKLKYDYRNYNYKHHFISGLEIRVRKEFNTITLKNFASYTETLKNNQVINIDSLDIELNLCYYRGKEGDLTEYRNTFTISFKPYEIVFTRASNQKVPEMDQIEKTINDMMKKFHVANTIFCSK